MLPGPEVAIVDDLHLFEGASHRSRDKGQSLHEEVELEGPALPHFATARVAPIPGGGEAIAVTIVKNQLGAIGPHLLGKPLEARSDGHVLEGQLVELKVAIVVVEANDFDKVFVGAFQQQGIQLEA